ncbi:MAG: replication initiation protein [Treponema sp.]|nr:replication initiation protein [Treponema sp.]
MAYQNNWVPFSNFERENPDAAREIYKRLPREMLVSNDLKYGVHTEAKTTGVRRRYIQINHSNVTKLMVFDVDNPISFYDWKYLDVPLPNILVINPQNNHAHLIYFLDDENFVCRTENGKLKNILLYESIYSQLCKLLNADSRYVQKIMKNPFYNGWNTEVLHEDTYTFEDFAKFVDVNALKNSSDNQKSRTAKSWLREGEGRNCTVFERTRFYAYAVLRSFNNGATEQDGQNFYDAVLKYAENINAGFSEILGEREIAATVRSIVNWTLLHFGAQAEKKDFEKKDIWGEKAREKSLETRSSRKEQNITKAVELRMEGKSIEEIMKILGRSRRTIEYYFAEYREMVQENPETAKIVQSLVEFLSQGFFMQFVISDIGAFSGFVYLYRLLHILSAWP